MRNAHDRPPLDQRPLPRPDDRVLACPGCGKPGLLYHFQPPGTSAWDDVQVHVVHGMARCDTCGQEHPERVCTMLTWPPSKRMRQQVVLADFHRHQA